MDGNEEGAPGALDVRRRRLRFRCWHRGMRETDLILGRFADAHLAGLGEAELVALEALMDVPDRDLLAWVTGEAAVPAEHESPLLRRVIAWSGAAA